MSQWSTVEKKKKAKSKHITRQKAMILQHDLDIAGLAESLMSEESRALQDAGWKFNRVFKAWKEPGIPTNEAPPISTSDIEYTWLPISNKWFDQALFSRALI